jgi:cupin fold WbuC family metalloprotein
MAELPKNYRQESPEVYYSEDRVVLAGQEDVAFVKAAAAANPRGRARLCTHRGTADALHEMLIVHHRDVYVRPHAHVGKSESFLVIEGEAVAVLFTDSGGIERAVEMAPFGADRCFYYRMPDGVFHTLLIRSEWLVFHEATTGPFDRATNSFPRWAPDGSDAGVARVYLDGLWRAVEKILVRGSSGQPI